MTRAKSNTASRGSKPINATDQHRAWLELVDTEGPFLAIPPLKRVWPQGMPSLTDERKTALVDARKDFEGAWETLDRAPDSETAQDSYRVARDKWVETILRDVAGWAESLSWGEVPGVEAQSPNRAVTIRAQASLNGTDGIGAIVHVIDSVDSLRQTPGDLWAANPIDRVEVMLRESKIPIGIVTDGRWWGLVCAREGAMAASGIVDALTWIEEPRTRDAFFALIGRQHLIGGNPTERLPVLFEESVAAAEEITEALGAQVRRAVELLIQSFSESAADAQRRGLPDPLPKRTHDSYEAAVTVMMRAVFLLFAEERGLLPSGELFEQGYGIARELERLIARETEESEEALDATSLTWHRLLATSQALYRGASFENLRMPAYGGSLFDPARFPFLTDTNEQGTLAIAVSDRVMLHVLRSVQVADIKGEARRISFRDIDVEQIGYIYEGLLGYTAAIADEVTVGLKGTLGDEPEIPLATLEALAAEAPDPKKLAAAIRAFVESDQPSAKPSSAAAIAKAIGADVEPSIVSALTQAVGDDLELRDRVKPWLGLIRLDLRQRPFVVLHGGLIVKETPSRKNAGAHYTPKSLAEDVVLHALQPLCYAPGPHQTASDEEWKLKSSDELLSLKVADIACGSGAFLVAAARYLSERVVEAWTAEDPRNAARKDLYTRAIRQVVANCLYGADINDMAVEMCKLSLWLVSLDRDLPFSFVDDKVFLGNSLLGVTDLNQLRRLHIDPKVKTEMAGYYAYDVDIDSIIDRAKELRRTLSTEIDENDPARNSAAKHRQLGDFRQVTADLRRIADGVVAAGLSQGGKPGKALNEAYDNLRVAVGKAYPDKGEPDLGFLDSIIDAGLTPRALTDYERWQPLHWVIEAPDIMVDKGGFDAVIGNPAFLHSKKITTANGKNYRDFLQAVLANGVAGDADLAAYFLLRQAGLLSSEGDIGIVVTKSIMQSHTKIVGLDQVLAGGATLVGASDPFDWGPGGAAVSVIKMWVTTGPLIAGGRLLVADPEQPRGALPVRAYVGTYPNGDGFRVPAEDARAWLAEYPNLDSHLFPYVRAADLSQGDPSAPDEYLIDLDGMPEEQAQQVEPLWSHLDRHQRPWRERPKTKPHLRERWWDFESSASALYGELRTVDRAIGIPRTSNLLMPRWIPSQIRIDMGVVVFPVDDWAIFGQVASSLHYHWVLSYGATTRDDPSYAPRRLSNTFPWTPCPRTEAVEEFESALEQRCRAMGGLRAVMNEFNAESARSDEVQHLRELFVALDSEVLAAFGWTDIAPTYDFRERNNLRRFTVDPQSRDEMLSRLLAENLSRAAVEGPSGASPKRPGRSTRVESQDSLFGDG
ncbi:Eco57I restriction-modification methylase domain-containing protein [Nocardioides daeguensis]|uniref:site-specific DNA-methyltransferase (adenine-specific) n=1 Tax=Nocardioides daeguensis TaxID=908359 RepID=A0ABP6VP48_9ACTN|nr:DNA methyltransferase [Nocardioides daeguensis]MBV6728574.1 N-6 DNA methylase [Nocardioides daeguensis]MCR1773998.1 N-6 DNA methylase [Nocardioides daeguensis]